MTDRSKKLKTLTEKLETESMALDGALIQFEEASAREEKLESENKELKERGRRICNQWGKNENDKESEKKNGYDA